MFLDLSRIRTPHERYDKTYEPEAFTEVLVVGITVVAGLALLGYLLVTG